MARGTQLGGTGDTEKIITRPRVRGESIYESEGAAFYEAVLMLSEPTLVEVSAEGPLAHPAARARTSKTLLLIPGEHVVGEGILLELHGFVLQVLSPTDGELTPVGRPQEIRVQMNLT